MTQTSLLAKREDEERAALFQRLDDLFRGTTGQAWQDDNGEPSPEQFMDFVMATRMAFLKREDIEAGVESNEHLWQVFHLKNYRTPLTACDFLYEHGVRA